ncbi:hypothetical protein QAD02_001373 [Eretmocerus hayati]|uniref:Uncharacterized protein n=1 Tax=Eretmocerus hayati TaxID=131215 RepID=A0ACC2NIF6_9HYME|nr:hypothetical protein QAD02_001373 [Eretmocerus hayati]
MDKLNELVVWFMRRTFHVKYLFLFSLAQFCSADPLSGESVRPALKKEFPFVVSIGYKIGATNMINSQFCGGTVITKKHVVTAASCLKDKFPFHLEILGGSHDINLCDRYEIASWITYNSWASKNKQLKEFESLHIAIITLSKEFDESKIEPVLISSKPLKHYYGLTGVLVGWGDTKDGKTPEILQTSPVSILTKQKCMDKSKLLSTKKLIDEDKLLCSELSPSLMHGDEGGPLLYGRNILIGINIKRNLDNPHNEFFTVNYHNSLNNYRNFFYYVIAGYQYSVA